MFSPEIVADFRNLLYLAWKALGLPEPTEVQYDIAYYLQHGPDETQEPWEAPNNRLIVCAQRGAGKSWITALYVLWYLGLDPVNHEALVVSADKGKADDFSTFCQTCLAVVPELQFLHPRGTAKRWSLVNFDVMGHRPSQVASCRSASVYGKGLTGSRAGLIVADDPEVPNTAETQLQREKLRKRVKEFKSIQMGVPNARTLYLGTPHVEDSLYNHLIGIGYHKRLWPARYPNEDWRRRMGEYLAPLFQEAIEADPSIVGQPTDPKRFGELALIEAESEGKSHFALQQMLDTQPTDAQRRPLRVDDLIIDTVDPDVAPEKIVWVRDRDLQVLDLPNHAPDGQRFYRPLNRLGQMVEYENSVMAIDPAGKGSDEIAWAVGKVLSGRIHVPELVGSIQGYEDANLRKIALTAKRHKVTTIVIEENFGQGMFAELLKPHLKEHWPCKIEEVRHNRQKELRIADTLEPLMNRHSLVLDPLVIQMDHDSLDQHKANTDRYVEYSLIHQMTRLSRDKGCLAHDDRLDVLAILCAYVVASLAVSEDDAMESRKDEALRKDMEHLSRMLGHTGSTEPTWLDQCKGVRAQRRPDTDAQRFEDGEPFRITLSPD